ncbi:hypothetical protein [Nitrolancea hollandica]|uniref:hypothetical protein n=1 Tax=Nitrolancea hollandica TaxID=1206749 RepID=UPI00135F1659|nr:hypothetical protein [Nitrolancea hollandica]
MYAEAAVLDDYSLPGNPAAPSTVTPWRMNDLGKGGFGWKIPVSIENLPTRS